MMENICCGCVSKSESKSARWWTHNPVVRFAIVLTLMTFPTCLGSVEENSGMENPISFYWAEVNLTYTHPETNKKVYETHKGKYGAKSLVEPRTGRVVHVRNKENKTHGCDEYHGIEIPKIKWIALVERGHCYFTDKIKTATKRYNASAVVIYNNADEGITIMQHTVEDQVSIFVTLETGRHMAWLADKGVNVTMTITPGEKEMTEMPHPNSISKTSVLFVSISFIVLMVISLAWLVFYYVQRFRYAHAKERLARRLTSAAKKAIAKIPQKTVKNGDRELDSEFDQCAVCIETYKPHDVIRTLPCKHVFHKSCVDPWLLDQRSCPMCKLDILRAYGMQVFGSQESMHQDPESGNAPVPVEDHEPSSTTDEHPNADTEVKVLLLPHTCLHFHPGHDTTSDPAASSSSSPDECHSPGCSGAGSGTVRNSASADRLSRASASTLDTEKQALMAGSGDEEEEDTKDREEDDEGFDEHRRCGVHSAGNSGDRQDGGRNVGGDALRLVVRLPEDNSKPGSLQGLMKEDC